MQVRYLLHNLVEASIDLLRYPYGGNQLIPWDLTSNAMQCNAMQCNASSSALLKEGCHFIRYLLLGSTQTLLTVKTLMNSNTSCLFYQIPDHSLLIDVLSVPRDAMCRSLGQSYAAHHAGLQR